VPRELIDDRLIGALHVRALDRDGFAHDPVVEHAAFQVSTLDALMAGSYDGDTTMGELLAHGDLGIGTVAALDGELVVVDGEAFVVDGDGAVHPVPPQRTTPFAVVCRFTPLVEQVLDGPMSLDGLHGRIDSIVPDGLAVVAVRVEGSFVDLRLRSVARQHPPYPPLAEVTAHQREWTVPHAHGSLVGFRFPEATAGLEVPGFHLHFLADDRSTGGHVLDLSVTEGVVQLDGGDELHVELPPHVDLGRPGAADRLAIARVEGARQDR
jgi:acetolactate decarboxylase